MNGNHSFHRPQLQVGSSGVERDHKVDCLVVGGTRQIADPIQLHDKAQVVDGAPVHLEGDWAPACVGGSHHVGALSAQHHVAKVQQVLR